jgi:uncharacterized protein (TIGR00369 family)
MTVSDFAAARAIVEGDPLAELLGFSLHSVEADRAVVALDVSERVVQAAARVHGGALAALVDTAATTACWATPDLPETPFGTTIGFSINYLAPGREGRILAEAQVIRRGRSISIADVFVRDAGGEALVRATVTYKLSLGRP